MNGGSVFKYELISHGLLVTGPGFLSRLFREGVSDSMSLSGGGSNSARGLGVVSDCKPQPPPSPPPQPVPLSTFAADAAGRDRKPVRLKREDHVHVKHDDCFSEWKVLVGPSDWKEHASGKIPDRFRISNLPSYVGSGLYELGVTPPVWLPPQRSHDFLKAQDVVVVYMGCSDNVHQHLLRYGQTGAHLEGVRSTRLFAVKNERGEPGWKADHGAGDRSTSFTREHERSLSIESVAGSRPTSNASMDAGDEVVAPASTRISSSYDQVGSLSPRGPRLFSEVFALGCSIAFRWAATESKVAAERAEADLMEVFDYAWKRGGNFRQRSPDILAKIVMGGALGFNDSSYGCFGNRSTRTWFFFQRARVGVRIAARKPGAKELGNNDYNRSSSSSSRTNHSRVGDFFTLFRSSPQNAKSCEFTKLDIPLDRCGAPLENGSPCHALPVEGGKRCLLHKDQRKQQSLQGSKSGRVAHMNHPSPAREPSHILEGAESPILPGPEPTPSSSSCFPYLITPALSVPNRGSSLEPKRRGSLSFTSWLRTSEIRMVRSREWADQQLAAAGQPGARRNSSTYSSILATTLEEAQTLESPFRSPCMSPSRRQICGLRLGDGTVCPDPPRPDRKRCEAHKGLRNQSPKSPRSSPSLRNASAITTIASIPSLQRGFFYS